MDSFLVRFRLVLPHSRLLDSISDTTKPAPIFLHQTALTKAIRYSAIGAIIQVIV